MMERNSLPLSQNGSQTKSSLPVTRTALSPLRSNFSIGGCGPSQFFRSCSDPQSTSISSDLPLGRNTQSIAAVHARIRQNLRELPFLPNVSVQIDLIKIIQ